MMREREIGWKALDLPLFSPPWNNGFCRRDDTRGGREEEAKHQVDHGFLSEKKKREREEGWVSRRKGGDSGRLDQTVQIVSFVCRKRGEGEKKRETRSVSTWNERESIGWRSSISRFIVRDVTFYEPKWGWYRRKRTSPENRWMNMSSYRAEGGLSLFYGDLCVRRVEVYRDIPSERRMNCNHWILGAQSFAKVSKRLQTLFTNKFARVARVERFEIYRKL